MEEVMRRRRGRRREGGGRMKGEERMRVGWRTGGGRWRKCVRIEEDDKDGALKVEEGKEEERRENEKERKKKVRWTFFVPLWWCT